MSPLNNPMTSFSDITIEEDNSTPICDHRLSTEMVRKLIRNGKVVMLLKSVEIEWKRDGIRTLIDKM